MNRETSSPEGKGAVKIEDCTLALADSGVEVEVMNIVCAIIRNWFVQAEKHVVHDFVQFQSFDVKCHHGWSLHGLRRFRSAVGNNKLIVHYGR